MTVYISSMTVGSKIETHVMETRPLTKAGLLFRSAKENCNSRCTQRTWYRILERWCMDRNSLVSSDVINARIGLSFLTNHYLCICPPWILHVYIYICYMYCSGLYYHELNYRCNPLFLGFLNFVYWNLRGVWTYRSVFSHRWNLLHRHSLLKP